MKVKRINQKVKTATLKDVRPGQLFRFNTSSPDLAILRVAGTVRGFVILNNEPVYINDGNYENHPVILIEQIGELKYKDMVE